MALRDAVAGALMVLLSVILFVGTYEFTDVAGYVSPRLFPRVVALLLFAFSAVLLWRAAIGLTRQRQAGGAGRSKGADWSDFRRHYGAVVVLVAVSLAYVLLIETLGYVVATVLYMVPVVILYGERRWILTAAIAVATSGALFGLFRYVFAVPLPRFDLF